MDGVGVQNIGDTKAMPWGYQNHWRDSKYTRIFCVGVQNPLGYFIWGAKSTRIFFMGVQNIGGYQIHCDTGTVDTVNKFSVTRERYSVMVFVDYFNAQAHRCTYSEKRGHLLTISLTVDSHSRSNKHCVLRLAYAFP